jgi:hypothetical protein
LLKRDTIPFLEPVIEGVPLVIMPTSVDNSDYASEYYAVMSE